jgi:hypothetical protein
VQYFVWVILGNEFCEILILLLPVELIALTSKNFKMDKKKVSDINSMFSRALNLIEALVEILLIVIIPHAFSFLRQKGSDKPFHLEKTSQKQ